MEIGVLRALPVIHAGPASLCQEGPEEKTATPEGVAKFREETPQMGHR